MNKIYDTHSDIFHNLFERVEQGVKDPFKKYHLENLTKGISKVVFGLYMGIKILMHIMHTKKH